MIDPNFTPPEQAISKIETAKRRSLVPWIKQYFDGVTSGIFIGGSLSYGADYSVSEKSDIDVQLVLDDEKLDQLALLDIYNKDEVEWALSGYKKGLYQQFSLAGEKDGVLIESHFWGKRAYINAINYTTVDTPRLRSSITTASTDYGFSFDGSSDAVDFYGEMIDGYAVSSFPSYRVVNSKLYLCRPITTIIGGAIVVKTDPDFDSAIDTCWKVTINKLQEALAASDDKDLSLVNALPSQYKMSPDSKAALIAKTEYLLSLNK